MSAGANREDSRYPEDHLTLLLGLGLDLSDKGTVPEELSHQAQTQPIES